MQACRNACQADAEPALRRGGAKARGAAAENAAGKVQVFGYAGVCLAAVPVQRPEQQRVRWRGAAASDHVKMPERMAHAARIDVRGYVLGGGLRLGAGVAHRDADAGVPQHLDVVFAVAENEDLLGL